jgi:hypothetical protein
MKIPNITQYLPKEAVRAGSRQLLVVRKHSPNLLFAAGVVGTITSTVLACRATLKLEEVVDGIQEDVESFQEREQEAGRRNTDEYTEQDRIKDQAYRMTKGVMQIGRLYAPAVAVGVVSVGCLTGSHRILTKRNAAVTAAYAALERGFADYRQRVVDDQGAEADERYRHGLKTTKVVHKNADGTKTTEKITVPDGTPSIYARCFDELGSRNWQSGPGYNQMFLQAQQNYANDLLKARGHVFLNEVYDMLGLERSPEGQVVGWVDDGSGDGFVSFGIFENNTYMGQQFANGNESSIWLDFNVDGVVYDKI